jgi:biotin-dependent carboxylase-like uncharacterized protein
VSGLRVLSAGPGVTLQDGGRHGYLRYGVTVAGPMDPLAHATANLALARPRDCAAIEVSLGGIELTAEDAPLDLAVIGGSFTILHDGRPMPDAVVLRLMPGERLTVRAGARGAWCYVAVSGRIDLVPALGSLSTHPRSRLGGLDGRALKPGDLLPIAERRNAIEGPARIRAPELPGENAPVRVMLGPQDDYFAPDQIEAFLSRSWRVGANSDRMAYALEGAPLAHARGHDIVSDGIAHGAIQVPGSGLPFVLMADRQPTGGYPKIATVIGMDIGRVAQARPGEMLTFRAVSRADAVAERRRVESLLARPIGREPLARGDLSSETLLGLNLVSGAVGGGEEPS